MHNGPNTGTVFNNVIDLSSMPAGLRALLALVICILFSVMFTSLAGFFMARFKIHPFVSTMSNMIEKALFAYGKTIVNTMAAVYGSLMVGALGVSNNLGGITTNPQAGFQDGTAAVISQNYGAKNYERVLQACYVCAVYCMAIGFVISGIELIYLRQLSGLFASQDASFADLIGQVYTYEALGAVPLGANCAAAALLYGLGKTKLTLFINFSRVFVFRIPVLWFLQNNTSIGSMSCGIVMFISNTATSMLSLIIAWVVIRRFKKQYLPKEKAVHK